MLKKRVGWFCSYTLDFSPPDTTLRQKPRKIGVPLVTVVQKDVKQMNIPMFTSRAGLRLHHVVRLDTL